MEPFFHTKEYMTGAFPEIVCQYRLILFPVDVEQVQLFNLFPVVKNFRHRGVAGCNHRNRCPFKRLAEEAQIEDHLLYVIGS